MVRNGHVCIDPGKIELIINRELLSIIVLIRLNYFVNLILYLTARHSVTIWNNRLLLVLATIIFLASSLTVYVIVDQFLMILVVFTLILNQ